MKEEYVVLTTSSDTSDEGILHRVFRNPNATLRYRLALFSPDLGLYMERVLPQGYSNGHLRKVLRDIFSFHQYILNRRIKSLMHITPGYVESYRRYRLMKGTLKACYVLTSVKRVEHFLCFAFKRRGRLFQPPLPPKSSFAVLPERLIKSYLDFCRIHKGHTPITQKRYGHEVWLLARFLDGHGKRSFRELTLQDLEAFCIERAKRHHAKMNAICALRSFTNYLFVTGILDRDWSHYIQSPCRFHARTYPKYLPWPQIQRLLDSIDRRTIVGKRYYAMVMLMACHGLRPREVGSLRISDIDWTENSLLLRERKNGSSFRVPFSVQTKEALRDYLALRPVCQVPEVFLTRCAPVRPIGKFLCLGVRRLIAKHLGRRLAHRGGAYMLRHSFAKYLLDRGATIPEIGSMLGHRSLDGTNAYLRIATEDLREVSDNYASLLIKGNIPDA